MDTDVITSELQRMQRVASEEAFIDAYEPTNTLYS